MKRKSFLTLLPVLGIGGLMLRAERPESKTKKLVQVKPFNKENITQEIAAEICAITCMQSAYRNKQQGFVFIIRDTEGALHIDITRPNTQYGTRPWKICVFKNGRTMATIWHNKGDIKSYFTGYKEKPPKYEYYDSAGNYTEYPCDPVELMNLYLNLGFYKYE